MEQPIRLKIGFNKNITVKKNGQYLNVYVNDNCFEKGQLVQAKSKSVWLKWEETLALRDAINSIEEQVICMGVSSFFFMYSKNLTCRLYLFLRIIKRHFTFL